MKRKPLRIKKRGSPFWKSAAFLPLLLACMAIGGFWYVLFHSGLFSVQDISVQGAQNVSSQEALRVMRTVMQSPHLLPADTMLFFPSEKISLALSASFPEIQHVAVQRNFFQRNIVLKITEKKGVALLCQDQGSCVAMDEQGIAIRKEDDRSSLPLFLSPRAQRPVLGEQVFDGSQLLALLAFKKDLESQSVFQKDGLTVFSFSLLNPKKAEVRFSEGWISLIDSQEDMDWQKVKLLQVLEKQILRANRKNLEYIDVRFGDQAYVKYR